MATVNPALRQTTVKQLPHAMTYQELWSNHMAALARSQPRTFIRPSAVVPAAPQDVVVAQHIGALAGHSIDYCPANPLHVERVSGTVTPGGTITITGDCFGSPGSVRMSGHFTAGAQTVSAVNLTVQSWTNTSVTATVPMLTGVVDQPVDIALSERRSAMVSGVSTAFTRDSLPAHVRFSATRAPIWASGIVRVASCATGETLPGNPDRCGTPNGTYLSCDPHTCTVGDHLRKHQDADSDAYSISLANGFVVQSVRVSGPATFDVAFDPSIDPSHVTWSVHWHSAQGTQLLYNPNGTGSWADSSHWTVIDYYDGSYTLFVGIVGPVGVSPTR